MKHSKKSSSKLMNDIHYIFQNVYVLYTLVILAVIYLFILLTMNNFNALEFFILLGIIIYCYTKNMSIILSACILFTLIIFPMSNKEGVENMDTTPPPTDSTPPSSTTPLPTPPLPKSTKDGSGNDITMDPSGNSTNIPEPATKDTFTGKLANHTRLDAGTTMTQAFTNLENMLGGEGMNNLSIDTKRLVDNQAKLFKSIENMAPLIEKASSLMNKFSNF